MENTGRELSKVCDDIKASGVLNMNKPAGLTSFSLVKKVKKLYGFKSVGHGGTLDPSAEGTLLILIERATKISRFLLKYSKTYEACILLGVKTSTLDMEGEIKEKRAVPELDEEQIKKALEAFEGKIEQVPPMFSAVKHKGRPLYKLARAGKTVERKKRTVNIYSIDFLDFIAPNLFVNIECSSGTYIRTLAHDIAAALGTVGCLKKLVRTRIGLFRKEHAIEPEQLPATFNILKNRECFRDISEALEGLPAAIADSSRAVLLKNCQLCSEELLKIPSDLKKNQTVRVMNPEGSLLGIGTCMIDKMDSGFYNRHGHSVIRIEWAPRIHEMNGK